MEVSDPGPGRGRAGNNRSLSGGVGSEDRRGGACSPPVFATVWRWPGSDETDGGALADTGGQQGPPLRFDFRVHFNGLRICSMRVPTTGPGHGRAGNNRSCPAALARRLVPRPSSWSCGVGREATNPMVVRWPARATAHPDGCGKGRPGAAPTAQACGLPGIPLCGCGCRRSPCPGSRSAGTSDGSSTCRRA